MMVEESVPLALSTPSFESAYGRSPALGKGVTVLFQRKDSPDRKPLVTVLNESLNVHQIRLTGKHRGWFKENDRLVLGGRELLEHETWGDLQKGNTLDSGHLHVYVKLSDISTLSLTTADGQQQTYSHPRSPRKSALSAALGSPTPARPLTTSRSFIMRGTVLDGHSPLPLTPERAGEDVLHLIIYRPKVNYAINKDKFDLTITATDEIQTIKDKLEADHGLPADSHSLVWKGQRLLAGKSLASYGVQHGSVLELIAIEPPTPMNMPTGSPVLSSSHHELYEGWLKARAGLAAGLRPKLAPAGTGGSYFIQDKSGESVAVFKPEDEEPLARNNPKGHSSTGTEGYRKGVMPGEGAVREVAAFLLDHEHFAGVPPTALVSCQESSELSSPSGLNCDVAAASEAKIGSLQAFVKAEGDCEEQGTGSFAVEEVHKIAILDMRLGNTDRNGGNILIKRQPGRGRPEFQLIPIDHGCCLPSTFADISFEWAYWPQANKPFSERSKRYIAELDAEKDANILRAHGLHLRPECDLVRQVCTMLLKKGAAKNLSPAGIASLMCRELLQKSPLEKAHSTVLALCSRRGEERDERKYLKCMSDALEEMIEDSITVG